VNELITKRGEIKLKKKLLGILLIATMVIALFAGCGKKEGEQSSTSNNQSNNQTTNEDTKESKDTTDNKGNESTTQAEEGKVLNIYCWNTEFQDRVKAFYPKYKDNGDGTGTIGDIKVNWVITPNENNAYQNKLDEVLLNQDSAAADDKVDMFLIEADYALKYVNTDYTMSLDEVGLTADDLKNQYKYTQEIVTDDNGKIKATSWQATPGLFVYRRSIAKDVLGTDDPNQVQEYLSDWDKFNDVAAKMKEKGYTMLSGYDDAYRVFSNNMSRPWVVDGKVVVDDNLMKWVDQTKEFTDKGYNNKTSLWSDGWGADQGPDGKTFGFFYSTWGINFTLVDYSLADKEGEKKVGNGIYGDWAVCYGPQPFYWGGTWICAARGTDNIPTIRDIMYTLTCDKETMKNITLEVADYTNNKEAMNEIANSDYSFDFLGGQNHIALFTEVADKIDMSNTCPYDQGCNEEFQKAFKDYFDGNVNKEEALQNFYTNIKIKYPDLTTD